MSDLAELEGRIRAALERIGAGIDVLPPLGMPEGQGAEIARLQALLAAETEAREAAQAQLAEAPELDRLLRQVDAQSLDNQRLRASVAVLRDEVRRLSEALAEGLSDPAVINQALVAEVEALRAQRASETTEIADILAELNRIVEGEEERSDADVEINIGERKFYVTCRVGEEDFLNAAAKLLDAEAQPIQAQLGKLPEARMLLMAGLMLADRMASVEEELQQARDRLAALEGVTAPRPEPVAEPVATGLSVEDLEVWEELALRAEVLAARIEEQVA